MLRGLLATSATRLEGDGLVSGAAAIGYTPYKVLIVSSLVEKEAITPDMPRVARVLYNRLGAGQRLQLDSTVNYPLDLQSLRTNADDRAKPGPYNSYAVAGLPPTPIAAPGKDAIAAALAPADGPWQYFVRCQQGRLVVLRRDAGAAQPERRGGRRERRLLAWFEPGPSPVTPEEARAAGAARARPSRR